MAGFLSPPLNDKTFDFPLGLRTDDGTIIDISLNAEAPNPDTSPGANIVFD